ncbi:hypothetical protein [Halorubrum laminariae]|uniref:Uncharacterized protein n=1 Tax=Halorubrum laminariae TaxID=1433523 RepID=A0ABD6C1K7_9EURY|nr:hypothetical protein [Halorubrum laminariae]
MTETLRGSTPQSEFTLTTTLDDDEQECACEECHDDVEGANENDTVSGDDRPDK